jgi:cobalt-zinc-cadmium efflux system outer membrane protein
VNVLPKAPGWLAGASAAMLVPAALAGQGSPVPRPAPSPSEVPAAGDSLALDEVLSLARERNPRLQALEAAAQAAAYRQPEASTLPDPTLQLGVMNFGLPDFNADMPTSMAPSVQVMQMIPFPGKLSVKGDIAAYDREIAERGAEEAWWDVRESASSMFYDLYALDHRITVMRETLSLLQDFQQVAKALYVAGTGRQADVLRADVEVARMDGDIRQMEAMRTTKAARLNALLDRPADTPVPNPALGALPVDLPDPGTLRAWAQESRPLLERGRLGVAQAEKRSALAHRQLWPDLTVGFTYGQRNRGLGTERMGSAVVGFTLPVHAGSRQYAARDEAAAMERLARAQLGSLEADVDARIGELLAELERARKLAELYRDEVIPEAHATVESAFSSYRVGSVDFMTLLDAHMTANRYEGELYQLFGDYGKAVAALESAVGRPLPRTGALMAEAR